MPAILRPSASSMLYMLRFISEPFDRLQKKQIIFIRYMKLSTKWSIALVHIITILLYEYVRSPKTRVLTKEMMKYYPNLINGDLYSAYLAKIFDNSRGVRYIIFTSHCQYVTAQVKGAFFEKIYNNKIALWNSTIDGKNMDIVILFERQFRREGDFSIMFELNHVPIYLISFTIVPGYLLSVSAPQVLFVSRVQGARERFEDIRLATKLCKDIAPPFLLVTAAQAIAFDLDIDLVAGVSRGQQLSSEEDGGFPFDYDAFWQACSGTDADRDFYFFPASFAGKPIDQISPIHRRRTRVKRQFKSQINEVIVRAFAENCLKSGRPPKRSCRNVDTPRHEFPAPPPVREGGGG